MSKRTFIWFGVLVLVLAVVIPFAAFRAKGDGENGEDKVPANLEDGQSLFVTNCGTCHALYSAGTDGNYAPDLDELLAPNGPPELTGTPEEIETDEETIKQTEGRVLNAIEQGVDSSTTPGRMPGGILNEEQAQEVSEFVARTAGEG
ncbi:MAG TPA: c-type cytochrome [Solirubrobacterales bacterium]|jgi:mono/diheme cytochrome c family protein|nr:c-type cytochrome [Solirubrobacterales bacterium]